ncbi:peptidoglycan DD-metalloendopeptidase family protein [Rhodococcus qingshengii]|uniref:peptidoglycan DD-metalloendopeptidase family protein n=1 Tax=Rhodococcus qingshengii TaxID=334542 RepID=UPI001BE4E8F1|nr:peptidoglycan DD-metalloendopeptidase family protein [Rhodococcus qingshengii]MBT2270641.1 peptidoglycan DD-metalloendopeptidase family protein [Rhodococcus qingshengii]
MGETPRSNKTGLKATGGVIAAVVLMLGFVMFGTDNNPKASVDCLPTSPTTGSVAPSPGTKTQPLKAGTYQLTSGFGPRDGSMHRGTDFAGPLGTPIYAATSGVVAEAGPASGFGNWVIIDTDVDGKRISTVYGHMSAGAIKVKSGDQVTAGQEIAAVGNEGESSGPHLHFEVWEGGRLPDGAGTPTDPAPWLAGAAEPSGPAPAPAPGTGVPSPAIVNAAAITPLPAGAGCGGPSLGGGGLKPGSVPAEFEPWILKAAGTCPEVPAPLLAGQFKQESGFNVNAHNASSGADGPAQFLPSTAAQEGVDGDGDGKVDMRSPADAAMSMASYDCKMVELAKKGMADGRLHGELIPLALSMYNCGPGNTLSQGQVCQNEETRGYVTNIQKFAIEEFTDTSAPAGPIPGGPSTGSAVVDAALRWLGTPYAWGGGDENGPTRGVRDGGVADSFGDFNKVGFDCSGLVKYAVAQATGGRTVLPHQDQMQIGDSRGTSITNPADLRPGDIIQPHSGHIFIWMGGGKVVEAPQSGDVVKISDWTPPSSGLAAKRFA